VRCVFAIQGNFQRSVNILSILSQSHLALSVTQGELPGGSRTLPGTTQRPSEHLIGTGNKESIIRIINDHQPSSKGKCTSATCCNPASFTHKMIDCQTARPTDCTILRRGNIASVQSAYRYGLEAAGLCEKGKSGSSLHLGTTNQRRKCMRPNRSKP
jgi:hypothetical protein